MVRNYHIQDDRAIRQNLPVTTELAGGLEIQCKGKRQAEDDYKAFGPNNYRNEDDTH